MPITYYGSEILIKNANYNTPSKSETLLSISQTNLKEITQKYVYHAAHTRVNEYVEILDELHRKLGGEGRMDMTLKQKILNNIASSTAPIGKKGSWENIRKIIATTIMENNKG